MSKQTVDKKVTRRSFVKGAGILGAMALASPFFGSPMRQITGGNVWADTEHGIGTSFEDYSAKNVIYTTCEQCNTFCTIKVHVKEGQLDGGCTSMIRKISGNPYSPLTTKPYGPVDYAKPAALAALGGGSVAVGGRGLRGGRTCLKGQAGIQTAYDALRVKTPLKRVGPRGSGKWQSISWDQAITEITEGSSDLGTPGLKDIWAYVEEEKVMADWEQVNSNEMTQAEFDKKYKDVLIDTKHPDFGPKANQIAGLGGDRRYFMDTRFWKKTLGSVNFDDHGGVCGVNSVVGNARSFTPPKRRMYADMEYAEFMIIVGTNPLVGARGPTWFAPIITNAKERGMKMAVVEPRLSKTAEKADMWLPVIPGADGALALAIGRWIVENERYDKKYLLNTNKKAAEKDNEPTWSDSTHLVNMDDPRRQKLRTKDLGIDEEDAFVVFANGEARSFTEVDHADIEVDTTINGIRVKSSFTLYKEEVMKMSMEEYAKITGISVADIAKVGHEFTSHGKKAVAWGYRGKAMHTNGYYSTRGWNILNHLIGNYDWKGGSLTGGAKYAAFNGAYDLDTVPNANNAWGIPITRKQSNYEQSTVFERDGGYPAIRPWFGASGNSCHELIPSADAGYPYPLKAMFIYRMNPILSFPAGLQAEETLKDQSKIPLLVVLDILVSEGGECSDYILPDLTYLERYGQEDIHPNMTLKISTLMQPVTRVVPESRDVIDVMIDIAKKMNLPGVGENAFADGSALHKSEDYFMKMAANIAMDGEPVPDADAEELKIFEEARKLALGEFFDIERLKQAVKPAEWPKIVYVLNRGGRFEAGGSEYVGENGEHIKYQFGAQANFYDEITARSKHSFTGEFFEGVPKYEAIKTYDCELYSSTLPLIMTNWKARALGLNRTISDAWLREVEPTNYLWMNPIDAKARGLENGDKIKITSTDQEVEGEVKVTEGIRPGVVGANTSFGHTASGAKPVQIDNNWTGAAKDYGHTNYKFSKPMKETGMYARNRDAGFSANSLLSIDKSLENNAMFDPIGGGTAQLYSKVEVKKL
ncbi:molybdopterin-dependent oxidoreductase [Bacillaceae bacterium IKA-2]|nr:molybdopterin-dependent oxidoreductase [Bacillaceae bacterium IKA-2]